MTNQNTGYAKTFGIFNVANVTSQWNKVFSSGVVLEENGVQFEEVAFFPYFLNIFSQRSNDISVAVDKSAFRKIYFTVIVYQIVN